MVSEKCPRPRNTGAQNPSKSGLRACVDWVQATFKIFGSELIDEFIFSVLGLDPADFREVNGEHGYQKCKRLDNIAIYYDGAAGMGVHLKMSGQGCRLYEALSRDKKPWSVLLGMFLDMEANFTRLDGAIDDFDGYFKIDQVVRKIKKGELVSKFKQARSMESIEIKTGDSKGTTIYFGSAKSRIQIRMYEKNLERENAGHELEEGITCWNRTEVQARDERAQAIAEVIAEDGDIGKVVSGILKHYLRFVVKGKDKKRSRWGTAPFWERFLGDVEALKLTEKAPDRTIEKTKAWLEKQVAPSLAALIKAYDGETEMIYQMIKDGNKRLKNKDLEMIDRFKRQNKSLDLGEIKGQERSI
jgi:phage replication initiation protein